MTMVATTAAQAQRAMTATDVLAHGYKLAGDAGEQEPTAEDAVWCLLVEAVATLQALPDREVGWLLSAERAAWPAVLTEAADAFAQAVADGGRWRGVKVRPALPSSAAIARMDVVHGWLREVTKRSSPGTRRYHHKGRRAKILVALAAGVSPSVVAGRQRVDVSTVHRDRRDGLRMLAEVAGVEGPSL